MARKNSNKLLHKAKGAKSDEFYTLLKDIENELSHYDISLFRGKTVYCNCDNPKVSNFFLYFYRNFHSLGLKKLICSSYAGGESGIFDNDMSKRGHYYEYTGDVSYSDLSELKPVPLKGNGDFRSTECLEFLKESDIVVTNPPFSLFRDFVSLMTRHQKDFLIIGNINAITYKEIFNLIQQNKIWLGVNMGRGISGFMVPDDYELYGTEVSVESNGIKIISPNNCLWLTTLEYDDRRTDIPLCKRYSGHEDQYPKFDNFDGINVNRTRDIPSDYEGCMGVPITFLHKYNPNQFEIIRFRKGEDGKDLRVNGKCPYFRIIIRNKRFNRFPSAIQSVKSTLAPGGLFAV